MKERIGGCLVLEIIGVAMVGIKVRVGGNRVEFTRVHIDEDC